MDDISEKLRRLAEDSGKMIPSLPYLPNLNMERINEVARSIKSAPQVQAESVQEVIRRHVDALQEKLARDEELQVFCIEGTEKIRVQQIGYPNWHVVILIGTDGEGNSTSIITNINSVKLVCKVAKVKPPQKPYHVGFVQPDRES